MITRALSEPLVPLHFTSLLMLSVSQEFIMKGKTFSITNVILGVCIFILMLLALIAWPDRNEEQRVKKIIISANLHALVAGAHIYMDEHDVNVVSYKEAATMVKPSVLEKGNQYADLSVFEINDTDTYIEIVTHDGDVITYEFEAFRK